jgi:hypothetical protein
MCAVERKAILRAMGYPVRIRCSGEGRFTWAIGTMTYSAVHLSDAVITAIAQVEARYRSRIDVGNLLTPKD